jgi:hypothetical protein
MTFEYLVYGRLIDAGIFGPGSLTANSRYFEAKQRNHICYFKDIHPSILPATEKRS